MNGLLGISFDIRRGPFSSTKKCSLPKCLFLPKSMFWKTVISLSHEWLSISPKLSSNHKLLECPSIRRMPDIQLGSITFSRKTKNWTSRPHKSVPAHFYTCSVWEELSCFSDFSARKMIPSRL